MSSNLYAVYEARVTKFDKATKIATVMIPGSYGMEAIEAPPFTRRGMDPAYIEDLVAGDRVLVVQGEYEVPEWLSTNPDWYRSGDVHNDLRYVRKPGDTMTGPLLFNDPTYGPVGWIGTDTATYSMRLASELATDLVLMAGPGGLVRLNGGYTVGPSVDFNSMDFPGTHSLAFGSTTRQMVNLYGTTFGIGVQSSALYNRVSSSAASDFVWFRGGVHSDTNEDPGAGGFVEMVLRSDGLYLPDPLVANLVLGAAALSGPRIRFNVPATGNFTYMDFEGNTADAGSLRFRSGTSANSVLLELTPSVNTHNNSTYITGQTRIAGGANSLLLIDGGNGPYLSFYDGLSPVSIGSRKGYVGFTSATLMNIYNEVASGTIRINAVGAGSSIDFYTANVYQSRMDAAGIQMWGTQGVNTDFDSAVGVQIRQDGRILASTGTATTYSWFIHLNGAANADTVPFVTFRRYSSAGPPIVLAQIGSITQDLTTGVKFNTASHGPWKGNVQDLDDDEALHRLSLWRPVAFQWKFNEEGGQDEDGVPGGDFQHGFIAQELYEVQPSAVTKGFGTQAEHKVWGERKYNHELAQAAALERGDEPIPDFDEPEPFLPWGTDMSKLVPDMVAAMQAMSRQIVALQRQVDELSAPAS